MIGDQILKFDSLNSTNDKLEELSKLGCVKDGTMVISSFQEKGKGQGSNFWESEIGKNLLFSIYVEPVFLKPENQFMITKIVSLAVAEFVENLLPEETVKIKWPNDIYVGDRKIAGILINNSIRGNEYESSIIGIGININQMKFESNAPNPVSIAQILQKDQDLDSLLEKIIEGLNFWYNLLQDGRTDVIDPKYLKKLYRLEELHSFRIEGREIEAKITGITNFGQLKLIDESLKTYECDLKEVKFLI